MYDLVMTTSKRMDARSSHGPSSMSNLGKVEVWGQGSAVVSWTILIGSEKCCIVRACTAVGSDITQRR